MLAAGLLFVAALLPLPAYLIAPGSAVDLNAAVIVGSAPPPRDRFFLTDVSLIRASPLRLFYALTPGVRITPMGAIVPAGFSPGAYDGVMRAAMTESQAVAAVVAERAAGYRVPLPREIVRVEGFGAHAYAAGPLADGDVLERVGTHAVASNDDVRHILDALRPGSSVSVTFVRAGRERTVAFRTIAVDGHARLGVLLGESLGDAHLAVPVHYAIGDIGGSSGGLMMALRIYDALRTPARRTARAIAGTGTIALDGRVGPIEGTEQKLIAAQRAGARLFFVPRANYAEVAHVMDGVRVIPVDTFADAVRALNA